MKERLISAIIMLFISVPLILLGGIWFEIGVVLLSIIALNELCNLTKVNSNLFIKILSYISIVLLIISGNQFVSLDKSLSLITLLIFVPIIFFNKDTYNFNSAIKVYAQVILLGFAFYLINYFRDEDIYLFLYLLLITISCDTTAYLIGKKFGKHKLIPKVSPNKTIEGTISGSLAATFIATIFYLFEVDPSENIFKIIIFTLILSIIGQIGDLFFSQIKRYYKVKDFSNLMPGHGGILDRLDSFIFVVITYYIFF